MTRLQRLEQRKSAVVAELAAISASAEQDGQRALNDDEKKKSDTYLEEIRGLDEQIEHEKRILEIQRAMPAAPDANQRAVQTEQQAEQRAREPKKISVPAVAKATGALKAFRGPDAEERAYASGKWYLATFGNQEARQWCEDHGVEVRVHSSTTNSAGGYLVPEQFENAIVDLRLEYGVFRREARVVPMSSDALTFPRRSGGLTAYFVNESQEITASDASWTNISLTARKMGILSRWPSELGEDAVVMLADYLASEIAYAFANKEDDCGFNGTGADTFGGINGLKTALLAGSKYTAISGNTVFGTLDLEDFEAMVGMLPAYPGIRPKWYIHKAGWANSMLRLQAAAGGNTTREIAGGGSEILFLGYPVVFSNVLNSTTGAQTSTTGLCYFGDLSMTSTMGSRRGVTVTTDASRYFELDQLAIRGTERFDIVNHEVGTASAAGPMIVLATPGS